MRKSQNAFHEGQQVRQVQLEKLVDLLEVLKEVLQESRQGQADAEKP